jgi:phospholipid/cholesterol/gamma-HCH transport system substrate-binding protein
MATRAQKVRLSIFLIGSGSLLLVTLLVLAGSRLWSRLDAYAIEYRGTSVSGLEAGAPVKYHGVQVGRVHDLTVVDPATVAVRIEVRRGTPITRDTRAVLTLAGITGLKFVELVGGSEEAGLLPPGSTIPAGPSMFETLSERAEEMIEKTEQVLINLNAMLNPESAAAFQRLLVSLAKVSEETEGLLRENRATLENVRYMTDELRTEVDSLRIAETVAEFRTLLANSNQMVTHSDNLVVQARADVLRSLVNLEEALDNLREATDIIRENPGVLIRGRQSSGDRLE